MHPDGILRVSATDHADISAEKARLHLTVTGSNLFFGTAALDKSAEVKALVAALQKAGVAPAKLSVTAVSISSESGLLSKSSKAVYQLAAVVDDLSRLGEAIGAVADQKNASLDRVEWIYDEDAAMNSLAARAMAKAHAKAVAMAAAIKQTVIGVRSASDGSHAPVENDMRMDLGGPAPGGFGEGRHGSRRSGGGGSADIGTTYRGTKEIEALVIVDFAISGGPAAG